MNNYREIDFTWLTPTSEMKNILEPDDYLLTCRDLQEAIDYMQSHKWCWGIINTYYGLGVGSLFCAFLFEIRPSDPGIKDYLWVFTGDIPPIYIGTEVAHTPPLALCSYTFWMMDWAEAAIAQKYSDDLPYVAAAFTKEHGEMLKTRVEFISKFLNDYYPDDIIPPYSFLGPYLGN